MRTVAVTRTEIWLCFVIILCDACKGMSDCCSGGASLNEKHAALLGLRAFVLTSPFDVPPWLSAVLMALVKAAGKPAPIKKIVR